MAGVFGGSAGIDDALFQHTAARRWLDEMSARLSELEQFQHTAARRWLVPVLVVEGEKCKFQHTAARRWLGAGRR